MSRIFISYRREDTSAWARSIYQRLTEDFPPDLIFLDIDTIRPGEDFSVALAEKVPASAVVLVLIGKKWIDASYDDGTRRLMDPADRVRFEIETALDGNALVIPVLLDGAQMPRADQLPASLHSLLTRNAIELTHARFNSDAEILAQHLREILPQNAIAPAPKKRSLLAETTLSILTALISFVGPLVLAMAFASLTKPSRENAVLLSAIFFTSAVLIVMWFLIEHALSVIRMVTMGAAATVWAAVSAGLLLTGLELGAWWPLVVPLVIAGVAAGYVLLARRYRFARSSNSRFP